MEVWKERFEYIYVAEESKGEKYLRKYDHTTIVEELEHFISEELDKAREEILGEVLSKGRDLSVLHLAPHIPVSDVEEILSKLKDNK